MFDFNDDLVKAIMIYLGACYFLYQQKHDKMFSENGHFRCFGLHKEETVFPFWLVTTMIGLMSYYILVLRDGELYM